MIRKTAIKPHDRFKCINSAITNTFKHRVDENLRSIGMTVDPEFIRVKGDYFFFSF